MSNTLEFQTVATGDELPYLCESLASKLGLPEGSVTFRELPKRPGSKLSGSTIFMSGLHGGTYKEGGPKQFDEWMSTHIRPDFAYTDADQTLVFARSAIDDKYHLFSRATPANVGVSDDEAFANLTLKEGQSRFELYGPRSSLSKSESTGKDRWAFCKVEPDPLTSVDWKLKITQNNAVQRHVHHLHCLDDRTRCVKPVELSCLRLAYTFASPNELLVGLSRLTIATEGNDASVGTTSSSQPQL
jgi:hypothetical protein